MESSVVDLYQPDFWYVLAAAVILLQSITSSGLRKWTWAAINLAFLGVVLGFPDLLRIGELFQRGDFPGGAALIASSRMGVACAGLLAAWLVLKAIESRRLGVLPLVAAAVALLLLFVVRKLPNEVFNDSDRYKASFDAIGLSSFRVQPLRSLLVAVGFSYVALRLVEALRLTQEGRHPAPDLPSTINYLVPFHMLASGPIQGYAEFVAQPGVPPPPTASDALRGAERIAHGLFKKYVLATVIDQTFLTGFAAPYPYRALEAVLFYMKVYLDFSGYSDMAVGAGRLMGIATPENFNKPYLARNLIDFWDRWHMSLSRFIYRNLFIPIQLTLVRRTGPQAALWCAAVAFSVSFLLCGLWHELNLRWAAWGAMQAVGLIAVNCYRAWLRRSLSTEAFDRYRASRTIRVAAILLTQSYAAVSHMVASWSPE